MGTEVLLDQLVNLGVTTLTQLVNGKPDIQFPAITPMTAIPAGTTPAQLSHWRHRSINIPWNTVWGVGEAWGSSCQLRLRFSYWGQYEMQGHYLSNVFLTRGDPWNPSVESVMKISINPGTPENSATPDWPIAVLPVTVSIHEHMEPWFLTGAEEEDYTFYLYGDGRWMRA